MPSEPANLLVFSDAAGNFYLLSPDMLDRARVPAEHRTEIEQLIDAEVTGYGTLYPNALGEIHLLGMVPDGALPTHEQPGSPEEAVHSGQTALHTY